MNLLAFDTSTDNLSIAVQRGGNVGDSDARNATTWQHSGPGGAAASAALIPAILKLMQEAGLAFAELDAIVFGRGPGSFTGLRTACSVAQGLAFAANVPVLPVDSLLAVAEEARFQFGRTSQATQVRVVAMLDARMDEIYAACYEFDSELWSIGETCSLIKPETLAELAKFASFADAAALPGAPVTLLAGNVFTAYGNRLPAGPLPRIFALPTAGSLLRLAPQLLRAGLAVPADQALPLYIRDKVAKTTEERLLEKSAAAVAAPA
jgi:tRNA threonylcarbamoyladenosine biosynthesis protein TsaB